MTSLRSRGLILDSIASWTTGQTLPLRQIELIVAVNGADPALEAAVAEFIPDLGRIVRRDSPNELELYDHAAKQARTPWLMFTEPHVIADPRCLEALLKHVTDHQLDGACVRTLPTEERNWVARVEDRMYQEDAATWMQDGDWRKFTKRGVLLRRRDFDAVGGLEFGWRHFSETVIAARLRDRGCRLGHTPEAFITHYNSTELSELIDYIKDYRHDERLFATTHPGVIEPPLLHSVSPSVRRVEARCLWRALRDGSALAGPGRGAFWTLVKSLAQRLAGTGSGRWEAACRYGVARLRIHTTWANEEARMRAFRELWQATGDYAALRHQSSVTSASRIVPLRAAPGETAAFGDASAVSLHGFHEREIHEGRSFRWTRPVASIPIQIERQDLVLALDAGGLRHVSRGELRAYWNTHRLKQLSSGAGFGRLAFRVRRRDFVDADAQILTLIIAPLAGCAPGETRSLGLPLCAVTFHAMPEPARPAG